MEEERNWRDLDTDCLINVFAKLDTETIAESVQFVCYTWYQATLSPQCWQNIVFPIGSGSDKLVKFAIDRSQKSSTSVVFARPQYKCTEPVQIVSEFTDQSLLYISQSCPLLKTLALPSYSYAELGDDSSLSGLIHNWKDLECLNIYDFTTHWPYDFTEFTKILESISLHCKNFSHFLCPESDIGDEEALSIVQYLPKIKFINMCGCHLSRSSLLIILKGCSELESVYVRNCIGFDENDDEIVKLAMHIKFFDSRGSILEDNEWEVEFELHSSDAIMW